MQTISSSFFIPREGTDFDDLYRRVRIMPLYSFPHTKDLNWRIREHRNRFFVHIDFDAFYAQVEQRDNINLRGKPVSVGGTGGGKGIVMTASYEARAFGVDTGMSVLEAKRICPQLISLPCYGPKYESIILNLMSALKEFVPEDCIEQYSIDECFADLTGVAKDYFEATKVAAAIKRKIRELENLTASMGLSYNKTYAKLATKLHKPDGLSVITQENKDKIFSMPANKLWGVGRRNEMRMLMLGIRTIRDLAESNERMLRQEFGVNGLVFRKLARGEDTSEIFRKEKKEKSLNHYHTLSEPIYKTADVRKEIRRIGEFICRKLRSKSLVAGFMHLSVRLENLRYSSDLVRLTSYTNDDREIFNTAASIYNRLHKPTMEMKGRQFGMGVYDLHHDLKERNLNLFENEPALPYHALDKLKSKYGEGVIRVGLEN
ncbi:MAG TPA: DNA polymerase IV [Ignavibacteria bacterium]|nr:DNA polymerase IV [Ignavibacteria bacterium]HRB00002.1 DNA polymerase IV [Ignavibacteria bacterium]